jgi:DNA primase
MGRVPEAVIREIRDRTDLVELIGGYVRLKRSGRNWLGLCPFHQEKTPSFNVSPERGIYHCFGCGVTGDAIKFLTEHDHQSFPEALKELAGRVGVDLSPYEGRGGEADEYDLLYRAHAIAERLYRQTLGGREGRRAREEISRRGLSPQVVEEYRLGTSPDAWDRLLSACGREGVAPAVLERAGLAIARGSGGGHYDRFRGRLMFPIQAPGAKVVGFGGRILGEGEPKYLNSPESPLFQKRKTLYGVPQAQPVFRQRGEAILVEGYTDVLALANAGILGALAALGTAFTPEHARSLARHCRRVLVLFDGDEAGRRAAIASSGPLLGAGLEVRMGLLPPGEDPDSLLRREGPDAFRRRMESAGGVLDALLGDDAYAEGAARERAVRRALEALAPVDDELRRRVYVEDLANRVGLPADMLEEQVRALRQTLRQTLRRRAAEAGPPARGERGERSGVAAREVPPAARVVRTGGEGADEADSADPDVPLPAGERTFVGLLMHGGADGAALLERFGPKDFEHPVARRIVEKASALTAGGRSPDSHALLDELSEDPPARRLLGRLGVAEQYRMEIERQAEDCRAWMERRSLERKMDRVMTEMRKAKAKGDSARVGECARERNEIAKGIAALGAPRTEI